MNTTSFLDRLLVCGFPGIGKSVASKKYGWTDSDSSSFSWEFKGIRHREWPHNYIEHLKRSSGIIMLSTHAEVRDALYLAKEPFIVCYPQRECKEEYIERYTNRGSSESFISLLTEKWDEWIDEMKWENRAKTHMTLSCEMFLSDLHGILWEEYAKNLTCE